MLVRPEKYLKINIAFYPSRTVHSSFSMGDRYPFEEERRGERPSQGFEEIRVEGLRTGVRWR